jgi:hypothetical protein
MLQSWGLSCLHSPIQIVFYGVDRKQIDDKKSYQDPAI